MKSIQIGDLKIKVPVFQGGMGVAVSISGLASAVANQGGVGIISAVGIGMKYSVKGRFTSANNIKGFTTEIKKARELSPNGIIGANIMLAVSDFDELFKVALNNLDIIIVGAGLFLKKPETVTNDEFIYSKTKYIPKISSARAALLTFKTWDQKFNRIPDAVVIEGSKAGGHLGFKKDELLKETKTLFEIIKETREILIPFEQKYGHKIPIIAGGGIYSGNDIFEAVQSGADGVKMGTRFVTTYECDADIKFKMEYINSSASDVVVIDSPVGLPGRAINNDFLKSVTAGKKKPVKCLWKCLKTCDYKNVPYCIAEALFNAANGNMKDGFAFAGSNAYKATKIETVEEVFNQLKIQYAEAENTYRLKDNLVQAI